MNPPSFPPQPAPLPPKASSSNTVVIVVVVVVGLLGLIAVIAVLAAIAVPSFARARQNAQATVALNNARQIQMAAYRMVIDNAAAPDPALGWPGDLAKSPARPVNSLADYVERLVEYKYLEPADLSKLFQAPGVPMYPGTGPLDATYSPFKIYRVSETDSNDCLFLATRNFTFGMGLDASTQPFGSRAGVICLKDGSCRIITQTQAQSGGPAIGRLPGGEAVEKPQSVLK